jgi:hypothetical protein
MRTMLAVLLLTLFVPVEAVFAQDPLVQQLIDFSAESYDQATQIALELKDTPQEHWPGTTVVQYLTHALWAVYLAHEAAVLDEMKLPSGLDSLVNDGYLKAWPENPFDSWQPMEVLSPSSPFEAGGLVYEVCPPSQYSLRGAGTKERLEPMSYQITVLGSALGQPHNGNLRPTEGNEWATIPPGAIFTLGSHHETAAQTREKRKHSQKQAETGASK